MSNAPPPSTTPSPAPDDPHVDAADQAQPDAPETVRRRIGRPPLLATEPEEGQTVSPRDRFLNALRAGATIEGAAARARIGRSTAFGWLQTAKGELRKWRRECARLRRSARDAQKQGHHEHAAALRTKATRLTKKRPATLHVQFYDDAQLAMDESEPLHVDNVKRASEGTDPVWAYEEVRITRPNGTVEERRKPVVISPGAAPDWRAAAFILERRRPGKWAPQQTVKHGIDDSVPENAVFELKLGTAGRAPTLTPTDGAAPAAATP